MDIRYKTFYIDSTIPYNEYDPIYPFSEIHLEMEPMFTACIMHGATRDKSGQIVPRGRLTKQRHLYQSLCRGKKTSLQDTK